MDNLSLGEQIKLHRIRKGWNQDDLAKRVGVTKQSISKWENGISEPKGKHMIDLRELFNTEFGHGKTGENPEFIDLSKEIKKLQIQISKLTSDPASSSEHYRDLVLENDRYQRLSKKLKIESSKHDLPTPIKSIIDELYDI